MSGVRPDVEIGHRRTPAAAATAIVHETLPGQKAASHGSVHPAVVLRGSASSSSSIRSKRVETSA